MTGFPPAGREVGRYVRISLRETEEGRITGYADADAHLRDERGAVRVGPLMTLIDSVGGLCSGLAALPEGWVVSTNLAIHVVASEHVGPFRIESDLLRRGRNNVVAGVQVRDAGRGDALVADGVLTSAILVPENGPPIHTRPVELTPMPAPDGGLPPVPEWIGARVVDAETMEMDLPEALRNPWGILHGGVVSMLVDLTAEHATGMPPVDVVLHFLAPNRVGPVRAVARPVGARADGQVVRVEVRDEGADRTTAVAVVTTRG